MSTPSAATASRKSSAAEIDIASVTLDKVCELTATLFWLRDVAAEVHDKRRAPDGVSFELAGESSNDRDKRVASTLKSALKLSQSLAPRLEEIGAAVQDGTARMCADAVMELHRADELLKALSPRNALLVELGAILDAVSTAVADESNPHDKFPGERFPRGLAVLAAFVSASVIEPPVPLTPELDGLRQRFSVLREELLGTNLQQNAMLDWKPRKSGSGVNLTPASGSALLYRMLQEETTVGFVAADPSAADPDQILSDNPGAISEVPAAHDVDELPERLKVTIEAARENIQTRGTSGLYLAIGFVTWTADKTAERKAPLLLLPVEVRADANKTGFKMRAVTDQVEVNRTLAKRLFDQFGIELPRLDEGTAIDKFFGDVAAVLAQKNFSLDRDASALGIFSSNTRKYDDLGTFKPWRRTTPATLGLLGPGFAGKSVDPTHSVTELDRTVAPAEFPEIMGCDGSQTEVLMGLARGESVAVEGPPGSGKSFVITEAFIQAVMRGETVLFTAAKPAALEVVYQRLLARGLGHLVLKIDSHDVTRKEIIGQYRATATLGEPRQVAVEAAHDDYGRHRDLLRLVAEDMRSEIPGLGISVTEASERLLEVPESDFVIVHPSLATVSTSSFATLTGQVPPVVAALAQSGPYAEHPFAGSEAMRFGASEVEVLKMRAGEAAELALDAATSSAKLLNAFGVAGETTRATVEKLVAALKLVTADAAKNGASPLSGTSIGSSLFDEKYGEAESAVQAAKAVATIAKQLPATVGVAHSDEVVRLHTTLMKYSSGIGYLFSSEYSEASKKVAALFPSMPRNRYANRIAHLDGVISRTKHEKDITSHHISATIVLGTHWTAANRNPDRLAELLSLGKEVRTLLAPYPTLQPVLTALQSGKEPSDLPQLLAVTEVHLAKYTAVRDSAIAPVSLESKSLKAKFEDAPLAAQHRTLAAWAKEAPRLCELAAVNSQLRMLEAAGFVFVADAIRAFKAQPEQIQAGLERSWLRGLINAAVDRSAALKTLTTKPLRTMEDEFAAADRARLGAVCQGVAREHWENIPRVVAGGQFGEVEREFRKNGGFRSLGELLTVAPEALRRLKPIIMATPDAVAAHLPRADGYFDIWFTDEASQQLTSDGLGALVRSKKIAIVGDEKQMPPSRTFRQGGYRGVSSLLQEARERGLSSHMLVGIRRFHDPSLIRTSNRLLYDNRLCFPPSPRIRPGELGVRYVKHDHKRTDDGVNRGEAELVVQRMLEIATTSPKDLVGVIAFSDEQALLIRRMLEKAVDARKDPALTAYFDQDKADPVIITALEKVQGRECDIMLISPGYSPGDDGRQRMQFSPLIMQGDGQNALNVGATRGRKRCEWITALDPDALDTSKTVSTGVKALKEFLQDAKRPPQIASVDHKPLRPLTATERQIVQVLTTAGYTCVPHVGDTNYYVNIAVVDPRNPDRFIAAIRTDDEQFHRAATVRDRHRLYGHTLQSLGWHVFTTTSVEWALDPAREQAALLKFVESAVASGPAPAPTMVSHEVVRSAGSSSIQRAAGKVYVLADISSAVPKDLSKATAGQFQTLIRAIADVEAPVHTSEVARRIRDAAGLKKLPEKVAEQIETAVASMRDAKYPVRRDFIYKKNAPIEARSRRDFHSTHKDLDKIAPEEIDAAILFVARYSGGIVRDELVEETCRALGYSDGAPKSGAPQVDDRIRHLLDRDGSIVEDGGEIRLTDQVQ